MTGKPNTSQIKKAIENLIVFCEHNQWKVVLSQKKEDMFCNGVITLNQNHTPEVLYYSLLHEMGHAWLLTCDPNYEEKYKELAKKPRRYSTMTYKIARLKEEIEAWDVGLTFIEAMSLPINRKNFERLRSECISSYISWISKKTPRKKHGTSSNNNAKCNGTV